MQPDSSTKGLAARWRTIRRLYSIYLAISSSFQIGPPPPYSGIATVTEEQEPGAIDQAERWMAEMDAHIQPHHLRQILQQTDVAATEPKLLALVQRHASKGNRSQLDSDKLNFVMTQYLWACAPPSFRSREITVLEAAEVLEPVLGTAPVEFAPWLHPMQEPLDNVRVCDSVANILKGSFVERGRELRSQLGPRYFERSSLLMFAYYNFCLRQAFVRAIAGDARRINEALDQLRHVPGVPIRLPDRAIPLTVEEVRERVREITSRPPGEYGVDENWKELPGLLVAVESALANSRNFALLPPEERIAQLGDQLQRLLEQIDSVRNELLALRQSGFAATAPAARTHEPFHMPVEIAVQAPVPQSASAAAPAKSDVPERPVAPEPAPAPPEPDYDPAEVTAEFSQQLSRLRAVLSSAKTATGLIPIGNTAIVLSAAEIEVVLKDAHDSAELIRQGIAARMSLVQKLDLEKSGEPQDFTAMRKVAWDLQSTMNTLLKESRRPASDPLSIASRQLAAVLRAVPRK